MAEPMLQNDNRLDLARLLVTAIETGDDHEAGRLVMEISKLHEDSLFSEIGKLTRHLHNSLLSVELDERLCELTENKIPDAKQRLNYVIDRTEVAAHRTLTAVEEMVPMVAEIGSKSAAFSQEYLRLIHSELSVEEFRALSEDVLSHMRYAEAKSTEMQTLLNEILMAQDFQDLTGQVIKKVHELVNQVETSLVNTIKLSGRRPAEKQGKTMASADGVHAEGPQVGVIDKKNVVSGQDEVDDLLSSLGF